VAALTLDLGLSIAESVSVSVEMLLPGLNSEISILKRIFQNGALLSLRQIDRLYLRSTGSVLLRPDCAEHKPM
jgi:hypothetical protein